jgi:hypothetical protein
VAMKVFVSYSRHDAGSVRSMVVDLQRARVDAWLDEDLGGGDAWWTAILEQIREATVFLFALSDNSLYSKPCRAELGYAQALGLPILPVQVGDVSSYRSDPIFSRHLVDYRTPTAATGFALMGALNEHAATRRELPEPLPTAPAIPYEYLQRLGAQIHDPAAELTFSVQTQTLFELRNALNEEDDPTVLADIRKLLRTMRRRKEVSQSITSDIDAILGRDEIAEATPEAPIPDAPTDMAPHIDRPTMDGIATDTTPTAEMGSYLQRQNRRTERERIYTRARATEDAGDWTTAISHYSSLNGYRDAETRLRTCQQRQQEAEVAKRRQAKIRFRQSSLGIPATLIAGAALTGAFPPIYLLRKNYPVDTDEIWHWQTASRILIGISFCFLAWMAKSHGDRRAMLSAALMVPVIVLHVVNGLVLATDDLPADVVDFLKNVAYPTVLALAAMVGILFGVAVIRKYRVTWAFVLIAWGVCGLLEAFLSYEAKTAPWRRGEPPVAVWEAADSVLVVQNLILLAVAVFMFLDLAQPKRTRVGIGLTVPDSRPS